MKKQLKPWLYVAAVLGMSVSCKKEVPDPSCNNGTCCGTYVGTRYKFIKNIENEPADYTASTLSGFNFKNPIVTSSGDVFRVPLCDLSVSTMRDMNLKRTYFPGQVPTYRYRVWGKIYENLDATVFGPPYHDFDFFVEKVEEIK